jgi:Arylsulfotransferase (ASST)
MSMPRRQTRGRAPAHLTFARGVAMIVGLSALGLASASGGWSRGARGPNAQASSGGGQGAVAAEVTAAPPAETISPLPGTPDADPSTQISFLGAPASHVEGIIVRGSISGRHYGRLRYYSTHTGGSFVPSKPFAVGEHVTVSAEVVGYGSPRRVSTSFDVDDPYALPTPPAMPRVAATPTNVQHFHSRVDLEPPAVTVTTAATDPSLGDVFVTPEAGAGQAGPMIIDPAGKLVWFRPLPTGTKAFNLNLQTYDGSPVLTWWQGKVVEGHGQGTDMIESARYTAIAQVRAGNGLSADLHDFHITPQGTAWITAFAPQRLDLSAYGGRTDGLFDDGVVQEIDIKTGLVMYQWDARGHVAIADTYMSAPQRLGSVLDYFHVNSIDPLPQGKLLISSRNTWAVYLVSQHTGRVLWRLGGKKNSFTLGPGVKFAWQHDAELLDDGSISLFDNDATPAEAPESRALDISLNPTTHTASLVKQVAYPGKGILSDSQGNVEQLSNGDDFIGWGQWGEASELSPQGQLTFDLTFAQPTNSYRAYRYVWNAQPETEPAVAVNPPSSGITRLYVSWNGATGVASWRVLAGASPGSLAVVGTYPTSGFETAIDAPTADPYLQVEALAADRTVLQHSAVVKN